ncbi:MAG TPA: cytochrome c peroxidase [Vicinamibacterales bacterium]|jgi:cytochrome c peroxidase|nr:cytochrome c peroxidase [Vicinamibacterales bacterium]
MVRTSLLLTFVALSATSRVQSVRGDTPTAPKPCTPTTVHVGQTVETMPADEDIRFGQCLFSSTIDFKQTDPHGMFASCNGCHPGNRRDRGVHPVIVTNDLGTFVANRQAPNLLNVQFNVPLGWDGRHGGELGDPASIIAAIKHAAIGAINSPVEMRGQVDPKDQTDAAKLSALAAFIMSRSHTTPPPNQKPPSAPPPPKLLNPNDTDAAADLAEEIAEQQAEHAATLARIKTGADVFFGRSESTKGLLDAGKACVSCHKPPFFTDNKVRTNIMNPEAAFDFGFAHKDGSTGPQDPGAGLVTVTDSATGKSVQVGTFKTPSLHRFYPDGEPAFHSGIFADDDRLFQFYQKSLGFTLASGESTGLHYWLVNCPQGPDRNPLAIPVECQ